MSSNKSGGEKQPYIVLARKYRPQNFAAVIGQDALVRTLKNAVESGRIPHAYMLTGVRGTGKTTTARLIARALNYTGKDGKSGPTAGPTDDCETCRAIAEGRHPDVIEMDAASQSKVEGIRELLDGVRYAPASARYKVYIIDEVHMLSTAAFNALLKTLEEPPEHVIFIFATTEIRKVPVTVLSRCQRFDLRRVDAATLSAYYKTICDKEGVKAEDDALAMIARAADGSVRDGLSLLDQSIALGGIPERGGSGVTAQLVRDMLGLADRGLILDMLEHSLKGECAEALGIMDNLYRSGADPLVLIQDMLDFTHLLTRIKAVPQLRDSGGMAQDVQERMSNLAAKLSMPTLGRTWQVLLKGVGEVQTAQNARAAAEMVIIRLVYAADLPDPSDLLRRLKNGESVSAGPVHSAAAAARQSDQAPREPVMRAVAGHSARAIAQAAPVQSQDPQASAFAGAAVKSLADIDALLSAAGRMRLASEVFQYIHLVRLEENRLEIRPAEQARRELSSELRTALRDLTGAPWMVTISSAQGEPTLAEQRQEADRTLTEHAKTHPAVDAVLQAFPGTVIKIKRND
jgi:DNA polymerase-3 subunit gamma/tau